MPIGYSISEWRNPLRPEEPALFYARMQVEEEIPLSQLAEEVAWGTSLTRGDIENLVTAASERVAYHLKNGDMVDLGDFGKFQCQLSSRGAETAKKFTHRNIKKVRFQFRPGKLFRRALQNVSFEHVMTRKSQQEARREEKAKDEQQP